MAAEQAIRCLSEDKQCHNTTAMLKSDHMKVIVFAGGQTEREISLSSANSVCNALNQLGYEHIVIDPEILLVQHTSIHAAIDYTQNDCSGEGVSTAQHPSQTSAINVLHGGWGERASTTHTPGQIAVINVLHGGWGESGGSQNLLAAFSLPNNCTSASSARILMNKAQTMLIARNLKISCPPFTILHKQDYLLYSHFPHIIKIIFGAGSSLGTVKINDLSEQLDYLSHWQDNQPRLISKFINGFEYSCAILDGKNLKGCMIEYDYGFCSYQVKRNVKYANLAHSPEPFHLKQACAQAQKMALKLYHYLKCKGLIRFDFMICYKTFKPYFLEANPNPGLTDLSIVPDIMAFNHNCLYVEFIEMLVRNAKVF